MSKYNGCYYKKIIMHTTRIQTTFLKDIMSRFSNKTHDSDKICYVVKVKLWKYFIFSARKNFQNILCFFFAPSYERIQSLWRDSYPHR